MLLVFTYEIVLGSDVDFILVSTDGEVLGSTDRVPYGFLFGTYKGSGIGSLVGPTYDSTDNSTESYFIGESLRSDGWVALCSSVFFFKYLKMAYL